MNQTDPPARVPDTVQSDPATAERVRLRILSGGSCPAPSGETGVTVDFAPSAGAATRAGASDRTISPPPESTDPQATVAPEAGKLIGGAVPDAVAGYEILGVLGRGGMGVVYKARQAGLNRVVALKMILSGDHADEQERARFRSEAEAVARIQHLNIIQIYEIGEEDGRPYFSLEYVDGGSLTARIDGEPQPPREAARIVHLLAGAMDCAHKAGVVHRDLKPGNVLLTADGTPKITDFGLAKRVQEDSGQTRSGSILGTPGYMAPEQAEGKNNEVGPPADVYALGAILYELLTGRMPFRAPSVLETLEQVRTREPVAPAELQPTVPRDLETICLKCLQKDPRRRYDGAGALAEDLRRFLAHEPILARRVGLLERAWRWRRRNPRLAVLGAATAAIVVAWAVSMSLLAWGLKLQKDETDRNAAAARAAQQEADRNAADAKANEIKANDSAAAAKAAQAAADQNAAEAKANEIKANTNAAVARANAQRASNTAKAAVTRMTETAGRVQGVLDAAMFVPDQAPALARPATRRSTGCATACSPSCKTRRSPWPRTCRRPGPRPSARLRCISKWAIVSSALARGRRLWNTSTWVAIGAEDPRRKAERRQGAGQPRRHAETHGRHGAGTERRCPRRPRLLREGPRPPAGRGRPPAQRRLFRPAKHGAPVALRDESGQGGPGRRRRRGSPRRFRPGLGLAAEVVRLAEAAQRRARSYLAEALVRRGTASALLGDAKAAKEAFDEAIALERDLIKPDPNYLPFRADLGETLGAWGDAQLRLSKADEAEKSYRESLDHLKAFLEKNADQTEYQELLARTEERLATAAALKGDRDGAAKAYREALRLRLQLLDIEPNNLSWQAACLPTLAHCSKEAEALKKAAELCGKHPKSVPLLLDAARCCAACAATAADAAAKEKDVERAVAALRAATEAGYKDVGAWKTDPDLAAIREEAGYKSLVEELAKR